MGNPWKHNLNTPEPPLRDGKVAQRVSGRVVSLAGNQFYAAGRMWPTREAAAAAASKLADDREATFRRR